MILDEIVRHRRGDVAQARALAPEDVLRAGALYREPRRGFLAALRRPGRHIIAEVKKASPSKGVIRPDFDPLGIASDYAASGAAAISVLTEERHFQGKGEYLTAIRSAVKLPLLRKDFVFDPYQIIEARALGADAVLLILAMLDDVQFRDLSQVAGETGLDLLVEVHDEDELDRALAAKAPLIGINNRNLRTFETSLDVSERLAARAGDAAILVGESGIDTPADIARLERCGVHRFLVGETLMRAPRPGEKLRELLA
jgi:indole-3-glycerol phosphate synthase